MVLLIEEMLLLLSAASTEMPVGTIGHEEWLQRPHGS